MSEKIGNIVTVADLNNGKNNCMYVENGRPEPNDVICLVCSTTISAPVTPKQFASNKVFQLNLRKFLVAHTHQPAQPLENLKEETESQ